MEEKGKEEEMEAIEEHVEEKSFLTRVEELIDNLIRVKGFEKHEGLVKASSTIKFAAKKGGKQGIALEDMIQERFEKFYELGREDLLLEKMEFLFDNDIVVKLDKNGDSFIPISEIYRACNSDNIDMLPTLDACIYFVVQHVCPQEDLDKILEVCQSYEPDVEENSGFLGFVSSIVGRVSDKLNKSDAVKMETDDGKIDVTAIGGVVQDLIGDDVIKNSMQGMMQNITNEDFDVQNVLTSLFNQAGGKKKKKDKQESPVESDKE
jgi:hypothetical protein